MQITHSLGLASLLLAVPLIALQGDKKVDPAKPAKAPTAPQAEAQRVREDLLGAWQLVQAQTAGESFNGGACRGAMLILDGYMSITAQLDSRTLATRFSTGELFSSGAYRWSYDGDRLMLMTTTMVSIDNFTPDDRTQYEPPGVRRAYRVDLSPDALTLVREGGGTLSFTRLLPPHGEEPPTKH